MLQSRGKFEAEINEIEKLLRKIDFFEERNYYPNADFDPSTYRGRSYLENWKLLISDNIYNFILGDNSILNFKLDEANYKLSFTYYECPYRCLTYKEYLTENDIVEDDEDKILQDYYEIYLQQCELKENPIAIRYDLDYNSYFSGLHPVSHLHIGHKNNVRLGLKKILNPKSFFSIILRQTYPAFWKIIISTENDWLTYFIKEKSVLAEIKEVNWKLLDYTEFYLS